MSITNSTLSLYSEMMIIQIFVFSFSWYLSFGGVSQLSHFYILPLRFLALYVFTNLLYTYLHDSWLNPKLMIKN